MSEQEYDLGKTFNYFYGHSWDTVAHLLGILLCLVSSQCQYQRNLQASAYQSQYIYYIWNLVKKTKSKNKAINIQYKLIEMSQTRAHVACTQMDLNPKRNKNCLWLYTFRYLKAQINQITNVFPHSITLVFRRSFDLSSTLNVLANNMCLLDRMKHNADNP